MQHAYACLAALTGAPITQRARHGEQYKYRVIPRPTVYLHGIIPMGRGKNIPQCSVAVAVTLPWRLRRLGLGAIAQEWPRGT